MVCLHIPNTQNWASGSDPTLLFGKRTERIKVCKLLEKKLFIYFMYTTLLLYLQIQNTQKRAVPFPRSNTKSKMYACARQCEKEICDFVFEH